MACFREEDQLEVNAGTIVVYNVLSDGVLILWKVSKSSKKKVVSLHRDFLKKISFV